MQKIEVKTGEYRISQTQEGLNFYTDNLNEDIAIIVVSSELKKVGVARNLNQDQLQEFFNEFNSEKSDSHGLMTVRILGGNESSISRNNLTQLVEQLMKIDNDTNIINIVSCDTCEKFHPNSVIVSGYHGGIYPNSSWQEKMADSEINRQEVAKR
jgi:hypothetical protein